ncbi:ester cyclase [Roseomonas stagni]|uniref:Ester cyclase n=1 Tax=Falsiroseomonas algicola TaxID=2716930 RepID=A0A6M1LEG5_9PROT|nr:ester cyclase [Falsiroseomonas algicola]NGM18698.1 ester cyclase [Falsiroseomonas algicola]
MATRGTLNRIRALHRAWNDRRWQDYAALLAEDCITHVSGIPAPQGKAEQLAWAQSFCAAFPDCRIVTDGYLQLFASHDGARSVAVTRLVGHAVCRPPLLDGMLLEPFRRGFDVTLTVIAHWRDGKVVVQHSHLDTETMRRQLRVVPDPLAGGAAPSPPPPDGMT